VRSRAKWLNGKGDGWYVGGGGVARAREDFRKISGDLLLAVAERSESNKPLVYKQLCAVVEGTYHLLRRRAGFILGENLEF
jgi:hypothetical protein